MEIIYYLFSIFGALIILSASAYCFKSKHRGAFSLGVFLFSSSIIHILLPIWQYSEDFYRYNTNYSIETHFIALGLYTLAVISVVFGYVSFRKLIPPSVAPEAPPLTGEATGLFIILLVAGLAIPALIASIKLLQVIDQVGASAYFKNRIYYRSDLGPLGALTKFMPVVAAALTLIFLRGRRGIRRFSLAILLFLSAIWTWYTIRTGIRFELFSWLVSIMVAGVVASPRSPLQVMKKMAIPIVAIVLAFAFAGDVRSAITRQQSVVFQEDSFLRGINGAIGNHENVLWLVERSPAKTLGTSYIAMATVFVPRAIWAEKPTGGGPILTNLIFPGSYQVGRSGASSLTTGFLTEAVMNGGWALVIIVGAILGFVLGAADRALARPGGIFRSTILVMSAFYLSFFSLFGEWSQISFQFVISIVALYIIAAAYRLVSRQPLP